MAKSPRKLLAPAQIEEWLSTDATKALLDILQDRLDWLQRERANIFFPGEPYRTQEAIIKVEGHQAEVSALLDLLKSQSAFEEELTYERTESQRRMARGLSGIGEA